MSTGTFRGAALTVLAVAGVVAGGSAALADGMPKYGSIKDAPAEPPKRELQITGNFGVTSDYVFRGFSQTAENPAVQAGVDLTYKMFYAGIWGSNVDFGDDPASAGRSIARAEVDYYAGIKPVLGKVTFDLGVIYYTYPGARDDASAGVLELDYMEIKGGASGEAWKDGTLGVTVFYSPEYTNKTGPVWTVEGSIAQVLPKLRDITPTFSALVGYQAGDDARYTALVGNGSDDYMYWNAGLTLGFHERFSIDFRYWDTNVSDTGGFCSGQTFQCDERFVASAKVTY